MAYAIPIKHAWSLNKVDLCRLFYSISLRVFISRIFDSTLIRISPISGPPRGGLLNQFFLFRKSVRENVASGADYQTGLLAWPLYFLCATVGTVAWQTFVPWGICITATVTPAMMSPNMSFFQSYFDSQPIRGIEFFSAVRGLILLHLDDMVSKTAWSN